MKLPSAVPRRVYGQPQSSTSFKTRMSGAHGRHIASVCWGCQRCMCLVRGVGRIKNPAKVGRENVPQEKVSLGKTFTPRERSTINAKSLRNLPVYKHFFLGSKTSIALSAASRDSIQSDRGVAERTSRLSRARPVSVVLIQLRVTLAILRFLVPSWHYSSMPYFMCR